MDIHSITGKEVVFGCLGLSILLAGVSWSQIDQDLVRLDAYPLPKPFTFRFWERSGHYGTFEHRKLVLKAHRDLYPSSHLRVVFGAAVTVIWATFIALFATAIISPSGR